MRASQSLLLGFMAVTLYSLRPTVRVVREADESNELIKMSGQQLKEEVPGVHIQSSHFLEEQAPQEMYPHFGGKLSEFWLTDKSDSGGFETR